MHTQPDGKQVEIGIWEGVKALSGPNEFRDLADPDERTRAAEKFLKEEENDSGIVIGSEGKLRFWHQHFQEYLAAQALAGHSAERRRRLFQEGKLHDPDWRESVLLLAGSLLKPSAARLDDFLTEVIGEVGPDTSLEERARTLALIGAMLRDVYSASYRFHQDSLTDLVGRTMAVFESHAAKSLDEVLRADAADAIGLVGDRRLDENQWVSIEAGEFWMGAEKRKGSPNYDPEARAGEAPAHKVWVSAFEVGRFPVTVAEYAPFVSSGGYKAEKLWAAGGFGDFDQPLDWQAQLRYPNRPVTRVSWFEASAYAASIGVRLPTEAEWERAARLGRDGEHYPWGSGKPDATLANFDQRVGNHAGGALLRYPNRPVTRVSWFEASAYAASIGVRLPTEAEWERAARLGRDGEHYPWGSGKPDATLANFDQRVGNPTPVGLYPDGATKAGLLDVAGNVWEWCGDWYDKKYYASSPERDPQGPPEGEGRVIRGGSWGYYGPRDLRCSGRLRYVPVGRLNVVGFRCVREVSP